MSRERGTDASVASLWLRIHHWLSQGELELKLPVIAAERECPRLAVDKG
jgi:hypothetical protein